MRAFALLGLVLLLCSTAPAQSQTALPGPEAYSRGLNLIDIAISPDGSRLAIASADVRLTGDVWTLQIVNLDTNAVERAFQTPDGLIVSNVGWLDERRAYYQFGANFLSRTWAFSDDVARSGISIVTLGQQRERVITNVDGAVWASLADPGSLRVMGWGAETARGGRNISASSAAFPERGLYRVDVDSGSIRQLSPIGPRIPEILVGTDDTIIARIEIDETDNAWRIIEARTGREISSGVSEIGDWPVMAGFHPDGRWAIIGRHNESDREVLTGFNPQDGASEVIGQEGRYDVSSAITDPWTQRIVGYRWTEDYPRQRFFDPELQSIYERVSARAGGGYLAIVSWSRDKRRVILFGEAGEDAGSYYLFEPAADHFRTIRRMMPELQGAIALGRRSAITYRAADGTRIPAYVTLPATGDRNLPLVLMPHGGPHARDAFDFDAWAAYLASRGFAVLQPNFRGSTGYGYAWFNAGRGNWGDGVMQTDINDGVDALVRAGVVDPNRVCIAGASYGGYAALAAATLTPDRYKCVVAIAGVSDLLRMLERTAQTRMGGSNSLASDWWRLSMGDRRSDRDRLERVSPANLAANVRAPILLMHGSIDQTVPVEQSRLMRDQLEATGKQVTYIEFENEAHAFLQLENRTRMLREMGDFVTQHIGQAPAQ